MSALRGLVAQHANKRTRRFIPKTTSGFDRAKLGIGFQNSLFAWLDLDNSKV